MLFLKKSEINDTILIKRKKNSEYVTVREKFNRIILLLKIIIRLHLYQVETYNGTHFIMCILYRIHYYTQYVYTNAQFFMKICIKVLVYHINVCVLCKNIKKKLHCDSNVYRTQYT